MPAAAAPIDFDTRPPLAARPSAAASGAAGDTYNFTINAAPGMDAQAIAHAVRAEVERIAREKSARSRSTMHDQD